MGDGHQVIQGEQEGAPEFHDHGFLSWRQRCAQLVRAVRTVLNIVTPLPLAGGRDADVVAIR